jgi:hypothetical protein
VHQTLQQNVEQHSVLEYDLQPLDTTGSEKQLECFEKRCCESTDAF